MPLTLTPADLVEITGKVKFAAQARELDTLGIPYRRRSDGSLLVLLSDVDPNHRDPHATTQTRRAPELRL